MHNDDALHPGMEVVITGLKGDQSLNGEHGIVKPEVEWRDGRVAVRLTNVKPSRQVAVEMNLKPRPQACYICLEGRGDADELLALGCGCRGSSGMVHTHCAIQAAAAQQERAGTWSGPVGRHPWQLCPTCKLPYTGEFKLALAREWCRRTEPLANDDPLQRFAARTALGNALSALGRLAEAEEVVRANLASATALHGAGHRNTLGTTMNLGLLLEGQGKVDEAAALYAALVEAQRASLGPEHRDTLATAMQLAGVDLSRGRNAEAEVQYREILQVQSKALGESDPNTLVCEMNLASALLNGAKFAEAEALYCANLLKKRRRLGPDHVDTLMAEMNLGAVRMERGDLHGAESVFHTNANAKKAALGAEHFDTCCARLNLVSVWVEGRMADKYKEAAALAEAVHAILARDFGAHHPKSRYAAMHWGAALHATGAFAQAAERLRAVHTAQAAELGEAHPDALETAWRLGSVLGNPHNPEADLSAAVQLLRATAAHQGALLGERHPRTLRTRVSLAESLLGLRGGDGLAEGLIAAEAAELLASCEAAQRAVLGEAHPEYVRTRRLAAAHCPFLPPNHDAHAVRHEGGHATAVDVGDDPVDARGRRRPAP